MSFQPTSPRSWESTDENANHHDTQPITQGVVESPPDNVSPQALPHGDGYIFNDQVYIPSQAPEFFLHEGDLVLQQVFHPETPPPPYEATVAGQHIQEGQVPVFFQSGVALEGAVLRRGYTLTQADCIAIARGLCGHHHIDEVDHPVVRSAYLLRSIPYGIELPHPDFLAAGCLLCLSRASVR